MPLTDGESQDNEGCHGGELGPGGNILEECSPAQSDNIDISEDSDQYQPDRMRACERNACQRQQYMLLRNGRNDAAHVSCRRDGECGDSTPVCDREQHPAVQKRDQVAVSFAEVNVLS